MDYSKENEGIAVNLRSEKLIEELQRHSEHLVKLFPMIQIDNRKVFEAWAIQKIAGLQCAIEELEQRIVNGVPKDRKET